ncbi:MAG: potassium transporter TrkG [Bacteroidota bacterium]
MDLSLKTFYKIVLWISILGILTFIIDFGFSQSDTYQQVIDGFYFFVITIGLVATSTRYRNNISKFRRKVFAFDLLSVLYTLYIYYMYIFVGEAFRTDLILSNPAWVVVAVILTFVREFFEIKLDFNRTFLNPAQLFIFSFLFIIFLGSLLLMLPNATYDELTYLDALFTSTSAVCVTGLIVVDTATDFTLFGQGIIMFLIQVGGLGILTFVSYFSYFFVGVTTYENQLTLSELVNSRKVGEVFSTLRYIILIAFVVEGISALLIFFTLDAATFNSLFDQIFFSIFHSISAFCNAGFSTLSNSLYEGEFRFNYGLQLIVIFTFVLGGLGFSIVVNTLEYLKYQFRQVFLRENDTYRHRPWMLNINSRITLITTLSLTTVAFVLFFALEYNNTLAEHTFFGKIVTALFGAATPRTAGFNSVDMTALHFPTLMLTFLLMYIGASPASTGGGIKTSTFAIAVLNIISLARGKDRVEVFRREIADISIKRAFAIISLSLLVIGLGVMMITIFDPAKGLLHIGFECFSAYSTVGLSLGITGDLSNGGKMTIIVMMFIGRISMLTIFIAFFRKVRIKNYRYPTEEITIN